MLIDALKTTGGVLLAVATLALTAALWSIGGEDVNWIAFAVSVGALVTGLLLSGVSQGLSDLDGIRASVEAQERSARAPGPDARIALPHDGLIGDPDDGAAHRVASAQPARMRSV